MKTIRAISATTIFLVLTVVIYYIHIKLFKINVVFYAAIADGVIAAIFSGAALCFMRIFSVYNGFEKFLLIIIWLILGYSIAISIPTVIDRSLSFYILEKLQQRGGGIKQENFEQVFTEEYVKEHRLVDVRLTEQLESGTIVIKDGCVMLTAEGERIARFGRYFRKHWLPKQRLLMGEYSDDLTDPFRNDSRSYDYSCKVPLKSIDGK